MGVAGVRTGEVEEERLLHPLRRVLRDQTAGHLRVCPAQRMHVRKQLLSQNVGHEKSTAGESSQSVVLYVVEFSMTSRPECRSQPETGSWVGVKEVKHDASGLSPSTKRDTHASCQTTKANRRKAEGSCGRGAAVGLRTSRASPG